VGKKAINTLLRYKRIFHRNTPVYINPDEPDWFIPTARADSILVNLLKGSSVWKAAAVDSNGHGGSVEQSLFLINRLIGRLRKRRSAEYAGRSNVLSLGRLKECWFHITNNCNLSCGHCMFSSKPGCGEELSREQLVSGIEQAEQIGCKIFYFTGGEPFVYEGFTEICDRIFEKEESHVVILSNGILIDKFENWLDGADKDRIHFQISVDGLQQRHDAIRGQGTFAKTVGNVRLLKNIGCNVSLAMAVTGRNICDMAAMVELAASLDVSNIHFLWLFKKGQEKGDDIVSAGDICEQLSKAKKVADANGVLIDNIEIIKSQIFSLAGTKYDLSNSCWQSLAVGPGGGIYPSPALIGEEGLKVGDISEGVEKVWRDSEICNMVRNASLVDSDVYCENPLKFMIGGGDIDHSYIHSGQLAGADPYVEVYNNIALEVLTEQVDMKKACERIAFLARMGQRLYECGEDMGEVVCTHSNCVLSLPGKDGHTLVRNFYSEAADEPKEEIFNPVHYDESEISHIPEKARIRSYGCGSPVDSADLKAGEVVVDFGAGTGVECFIAAKKVGKDGRVYGIDMADAMLNIANQAREKISENLGYENVEFRKAFLEDTQLQADSVDVVISNCVINLSPDKRKTFGEISRILKPGGRLVISDIAYDGEIPINVKYNEKLRGECIGGAFEQAELFGLLSDVGFEGSNIIRRFLYRVVAGYNFYSVTYSARKPALACRQEVIYTGPLAAAVTEDGHILKRGERTSIESVASISDCDSVFVLDEQGNVSNVEQENSCCCFSAISPDQVKSESKICSGCMVCGGELVYSQQSSKAKCYYCGDEVLTNTVCDEGHFVCDKCHCEDAISIIKKVCLDSDERDMLSLMHKIRSHPGVPMHGPEHHAMVPAVILTVYRNITGELGWQQILAGIERGKTVAGGACAFMGICGAATGVGIALAIVLESDPYKAKQRQQVQEFTAKILQAIAGYEAARCCQRDCWVALKEVSRLSKDYFGVLLPAEDDFHCEQYGKNKECMHGGCPLWSCEADEDLAAEARPKVSIVVPVFNEYDQINATIAQLRKIGATDDSCEIIIVDGDRRRSTIKVINDDGVRAIVSAKGRGAQMNAGAKIANGEVVLFLHADTELPEGAMGKIGAVLEDKKYVGGAFNLGIDSDRLFLRWIEAGVNRRCRLSRVPYGDQAIFIRKDYFNEIGQFKDVPLMEDVDLMRRIKKRGDKIFILPEKIMTSSRRWETEGAIYTMIRNQALVSLYYLGVGPKRLARFYRICSNGLVKKKSEIDIRKKCVLLFVKYPTRGRVKTRLAEQIGEEAALGLYKNFVTDILATLKKLDVDFKIVFDPAESEDMFQRWLGKEYSYVAQVGQGLGERIKNAFLQAFGEGFDSAVVIGSDSPDLSAERLKLAFEGLCGDDAVIGPSSDGGYYVIGFAKDSFLPEAFDGIGWSSDRVFEQTSDILRGHGLKYRLLPVWHDVDNLADLKLFAQRNEKSAFSDSATMRYFAEHKDIELEQLF